MLLLHDTGRRSRTTSVNTPTTDEADLKQLNELPLVHLIVKTKFAASAVKNRQSCYVEIQNPTPQLAFLVHLRIAKKTNREDIAPILWSDNYFSLMPGEKKVIRANYPDPHEDVQLVTEGWNVN